VTTKTCFTCAHWEADRFTTLEPRHRTGLCKIKLGTRVEIELDYAPYGGGALVDTISTAGDFGCVEHEAQR
jgi:hypothetical protein